MCTELLVLSCTVFTSLPKSTITLVKDNDNLMKVCLNKDPKMTFSELMSVLVCSLTSVSSDLHPEISVNVCLERNTIPLLVI